jgi:hypothetical protein
MIRWRRASLLYVASCLQPCSRSVRVLVRMCWASPWQSLSAASPTPVLPLCGLHLVLASCASLLLCASCLASFLLTFGACAPVVSACAGRLQNGRSRLSPEVLLLSAALRMIAGVVRFAICVVPPVAMRVHVATLRSCVAEASSDDRSRLAVSLHKCCL